MSTSFTETFSTTTYKDAANTTGYWYGTGTATMAAGNVSSTLYEIVNPTGVMDQKDIQAISCTSATVCYAIHEYNYPAPEVLKTTDGGTTWSSIHGGNYADNDASGPAPYDIYAIPGTTVVYVLARGAADTQTMVIKTTDGGLTWTRSISGLPTGYVLYGITCPDINTCVIAGDNNGGQAYAYFSTDGGATWTAATNVPATVTQINAIGHYNDGASTTYRMVGTNGVVFVSKATTTPYVWTAENSGIANDLYDVRMADYNHVYLVGGTAGTPRIRKSVNGGASYAAQTPTGTGIIYAVDCDTTTTSTCWAVGASGETRLTTTGGSTWTLVEDNGWTGAEYHTIEAVSASIAYAAGVATTFSANLIKTSTSTHFTNLFSNPLCSPNVPGCEGSFYVIPNDLAITGDGQTIYAVGDDGGTGYVAKSTNGGTTWAQAASNNPGRINDLDCLTPTLCVGGGIFGEYFITANGGSSWSTGTTTTVHFNEVDMVTTLAGWAAMSGAPSVIRTQDGGTTWLNGSTGLPSDFTTYDVVAVSTSSAYIAGFSTSANAGRVYYTGNSGASWTQKLTQTGQPFYKLHFLPDYSVAWAFTYNDVGSTVVTFRSDNGGATWSQQGTFDTNTGLGSYTGVHFLDANIGMMASSGCGSGYFGITVNGGQSWMKRKLECVNSDMVAFQNTLYAASNASYGLIYKITIPVTTSTIQSLTIDSISNDITCAGITPTQTLNGGTVTYEMSNDGGSTWAASGGSCSGITDTNEFAFATTGSDLRWRATLSSPYSAPTTTPVIDALAINYVYNTAPSTPTNSTPANAATGVLIAPTLTASAFSDTDVGDTHDSSRWEISSVSGNYTNPVYATTSSSSLTSLTVPSGNLTYGSTYYWHVRYADNNGGLSSFSSQTSFTTMADPTAGSAGDAAWGPESFVPPSPPLADGATPGPQPNQLTWRFKDTSANELGFSIVDTGHADAVEISTNPIFTQNIDHLSQDTAIPSRQYCGRAVVAFNQFGNSAITPSSTYPCVYALPARPKHLVATAVGPTHIRFGGITEGDGNDAETDYAIFEETTGQWLASGLHIAADAEPVGATYVLGGDPVRQTAAAWGEEFRLAGLTPETEYRFVVVATTGAGAEARSTDTSVGETGSVVRTTAAPVRLIISKTVAITRNAAALAAIATVADWSLIALCILGMLGVVAFFFFYRKHGFVRCVNGICSLHLSPSHSYERVTHPEITAVPYVVHRDVHRYARTMLAIAAAALLVKLALSGLLLWNPAAVFGADVPDAVGQSVVPGDYLTYRITVENRGPSDATGMVVSDTLPATIALMPGTITIDGVRQTDLKDDDAGTYSARDNDRTVIGSRNRLAVGQTTVLTFQALVLRPSEVPANTPAGTIGEIANVGCVRIKELDHLPQCTARQMNPIVDRRAPPQPVNAHLPEPEQDQTNAPRPIRVRTAKELAGKKYKTLRFNGLLSGAYLIDRRPVVSGYAPAGDLLVLVTNNRPVATTRAGNDGYYAFTPAVPLVSGLNQFRILDVLPDAVAHQPVQVERHPRTPPHRALPAGRIENKPRRETTPALTGTAPAGAAVSLVADGVVVDSGSASPEGVWTLTVPAPLAPGNHLLTVHGPDGALGRDTYVVSPEAPAGPESEQVAMTAEGDVPHVNDPTPDLVGQAPPQIEVVLLQGDTPLQIVSSDVHGAWRSTISEPIPEGDVDLAAAASGGEVAVGAVTIIEQQATDIRINGAPPDLPTNDPTPEMTGVAPAGSVVSIAVDGSVVGVAQSDADGRFTFLPSIPLEDGTHRAAVLIEGQELDAAEFRVDTIPPEQPAHVSVIRVNVQSRWLGDGNNTTVTVQGETGDDAARVHIRLQSDPIDVDFAPPGAVWERDVSAALEPGKHTVTVTAFDGAGNASASAIETFLVPEQTAGSAVVGELVSRVRTFVDDPTVERVAQVSAPVVVTVAVANTAAAVGFGPVAQYFGLLFTQPFLLIGRRRRTGYGKIYNALNKLPVDLAIVRLVDAAQHHVISTKVTDRLGRYEFLVGPGQYLIEVTKKGFTVPSAYLAGKTEDIFLADVWTGAVLPFTQPGRVAYNVPADPMEDTRTPATITAARFMRRVQYLVALSGPALSLVSVAITPTVFVFGMLVLQFVAFFLFRRLAYRRPPKSYGQIRGRSTGTPVAGAIVRLFEVTYNKLLETQVTDRLGRYAFLVGPSRYYFTVEKDGYAPYRSSILDLTSAGSESVIAQDTVLDAPNTAPVVPPDLAQPNQTQTPNGPQNAGPVVQ